MIRVPALAVICSALLLSSARAGELEDFFIQLPASCFEKWSGDGVPLIARTENRRRLVQGPPAELDKRAAALGLRNAVIDNQHGFLTFGSNTDGEGDVFTLSFWRCDDGSRLVGVTLEHWSASTSDTPHVSFWRSAGGRMLEVTDKLIPVIPLAKFFDRHPELAKAAAADGFHWKWTLPQRGTTIRVQAPAIQLLDEYAALGDPDHAFEGQWDGKGFTWVRVEPKK